MEFFCAHSAAFLVPPSADRRVRMLLKPFVCMCSHETSFPQEFQKVQRSNTWSEIINENKWMK
jgi:hypothetical protein